jgi:mannose-6-phosphate isomerase-like protein (cupin superfamily)
MEIRNLDHDNLKAEYGAFTQRLLPWAALNAPFEGAWSIVKPGTATTAHEHHEYEMFIGAKGVAVIECEGERRPFVAGDLVFMPPHEFHQVINDSDVDFEFFSVWWDPEMSERFTARHAEATR